MYFLHLILITVVGVVLPGECSEWNYKGETGPEKWPAIAPACGMSTQSPIDIVTNDVFLNPRLGLLQLIGYNQTLSGGQFINNGHTVQLNMPTGKVFEFAEKGTIGRYRPLQLHFHWSRSNSSVGGSEHTVNGMHYDAEMHIVHIKQPYTSLGQVKSMSDGLAVLGVFLKVSKIANDNPHFQLLLNAIKLCHYNGETCPLTTGPSLLSLLPISGSYYRYNGSLTTPPCYETVLWNIYQEPVIISQKQLEVFQSLSNQKSSKERKPDGNHKPDDGSQNDRVNDDDDDELSDNYRPTQSLNGRVVSAYYDISVTTNDDEPKDSWHYEGKKGPENWPTNHALCKGNKQSPINFMTNVTSSSTAIGKLEFSPSYDDKTSGHVTNNGHTVMFTLSEKDVLTFSSGEKQYQVLQVHFHWGEATVNGNAVSSRGGSEHTINGIHYPIEMHIVHKKVESDEEHDDDLAVIGVFFDLGEDNDLASTDADEALKGLTEAFHHVPYEDDEAPLNDGPILNNLLPANQSYFRYMGSLTTPPCTESVMWSVFTKPVLVSKERFLEFQSFFKVRKSQVIQLNSTNEKSKDGSEDTHAVLTKSLLVGNYRPTQPYDNQLVVIYLDANGPSFVPPQTNTTAIVLCALAGLLVFVGIIVMMLCCRRKDKKTKESTTYEQVSTTQPITDASHLETI